MPVSYNILAHCATIQDIASTFPGGVVPSASPKGVCGSTVREPATEVGYPRPSGGFSTSWAVVGCIVGSAGAFWCEARRPVVPLGAALGRCLD